MKIAIVGCGIGGLAAALFLHRQGHDLTVLESFDRARPVGSGLMIQPTGQAVLARLGLLEAALQRSARVGRLDGRDIKGPRPLNLLYSDWQPTAFGLGMHRAELFGLLYDAAQSEGIAPKTSHRVAASHQDAQGRWLVLQSDQGDRGDQAAAKSPLGPFDLVVDASGSHSPLRGDLVTRDRPFPFGAVWSCVDTDALADDRLHQRFDGARFMMGALPLGRNLPHRGRSTTGTAKTSFAIFWSLQRGGLEAWQNDYPNWLNSLQSFWPELAPAIAELEGPQAFAAAWYNDTCLKRFVQPGMAHIGDAAHTTSPQLGQGGNLALLDAAVLADALRANDNLAAALAAYDANRRPHVQLYQRLSRWVTPLFQSDQRAWGWLRNVSMPLAGRIGWMARTQTRVMSGVQTGLLPWQHTKAEALAGGPFKDPI